MKKRFIKGLVATVTALAMAVNVMAAGSIVGAIDMPKVQASEGKAILREVTANMYEENLQRVVDKINAAPRQSTVADAFGDDLTQIDLYDVKGLKIENVDLSEYKFLSPIMDLQLEGVTPTQEDPVRVTFVANNMTDNLIVDVLHYCGEHKWEVLEGTKLSSNEVAADFHSTSPVALIYKEKAPAVVDTEEKAPQTGERTAWPLAAGGFVLLAFGIFAIRRYRKA